MRVRGSEIGKAESGNLKPETGDLKADERQGALEELREMIAIVRPVALRERMMRAWMRL